MVNKLLTVPTPMNTCKLIRNPTCILVKTGESKEAIAVINIPIPNKRLQPNFQASQPLGI